LVCGTIVILCAINYVLVMGFLPYSTRPPNAAIHTMDEGPERSNIAAYFYKNHVLPPSNYQYISKTGAEIVAEYDAHFAKSQNLYLEFEGMALASLYADTRRLKPVLPPLAPIITTEEIVRDFHFVIELLDLKERGYLKADEFFEVPIKVWPIETWDQESRYVYGYRRKIYEFLKGTPLEKIDTRSRYYLKYEALKRAVAISSQ
jgi:hypothetical protein